MKRRRRRNVVHWWCLLNAKPASECGFAPIQGQEHRQTAELTLVTCRRCLRSLSVRRARQRTLPLVGVGGARKVAR